MKTITVAYGDGIGPEIMEAVLKILKAAGAEIKVETIEIGQKNYERGWLTGIKTEDWDIIKRNKILLKAPITTPQGQGVKSLNVTLRKNLGLYANIRPCISYLNQVMDLVIIRENEEDLYAGIEYQQSAEVYHSIKIITKGASEKICYYAFEYAKANNRKKVACFIKDNIMKLTDGAFHKAFKSVALQYPEIQSESYIIDIGAARLAKYPQKFEVIVAPNLYGDIISDIAAEISGSVGLAGSVNLGDDYAMFEAVHGSAPDIAGRGIANPSGLLNAAIYMLDYLGQGEVAKIIYQAWLKAIKDGVHTADIYTPQFSKQKVSTEEFTNYVINQLKNCISPAMYNNCVVKLDKKNNIVNKSVKKRLIGVDIDVCWASEDLLILIENFRKLSTSTNIMLCDIKIKGVIIWPEPPLVFPSSTNNLTCRFIVNEEHEITDADINDLLVQCNTKGIEVLKMEKLYLFGSERGFFI